MRHKKVKILKFKRQWGKLRGQNIFYRQSFIKRIAQKLNNQAKLDEARKKIYLLLQNFLP